LSYLVFARKFRPQRFEDVIGQEHITATLQNAIRENRIAQSFLFSGTRGVGKTSTARILAKALNCEKEVVMEPCGKCFACLEITQGTSLDVLEIDGASNRGIDEIRNLRESVKFRPAQSRFKIYIIDEVHMLTAEAFNALLKTLEEPPDHVKFIFATTELHKIPLTILSRCQKFVFRRVATAKIADKLKEIADQEKIKYDDKALYALAKGAEGSLRDAESLLDQVASFSKGKVSYDRVLEAFGLSADETFLGVLDAIAAHDAKKLLEIFSPLGPEGRDVYQFVRGLAEMFRALLILKATGTYSPELIDLAPELARELEARKDLFSKEDLLSINQLIQNLLAGIRRTPLPELQTEIFLIRLASRESLVSLAEIQQKLDSLGRTSGSPGTGGPPASEVRPPRPSGVSLAISKPEGSALAIAVEPAPLPPPVQQKETAGFILNDVERVWAEAVERVKAKKMSCGTYLAEAAPVEVEGNVLSLSFPQELKFHKESVEKSDNKKLVEDVFQALLGFPVKVSFVISVAERSTLSQGLPAAAEEKVPEIVESALKLFEGKILKRP
jgi:DNA polymerase-3 subunit gamma/tau